MAKRQHTIGLEVTQQDAVTACLKALLRLGWEVSEKAEDHLVAEEEPWRLACRYTPSRIDVELRAESPTWTDVHVTVSTPGFGPLAGPRLERQIAAFEEKTTDVFG